MARFYAEIQGNRGEATRMGTPVSGIRGHIRGWHSGVKVMGRCDPYNPDSDSFDIYATSGSNGGERDVFIGTVTRDKETGKVTVEISRDLPR